MQVLSDTPYIAVIKDFLTPEECSHFVELGRQKIAPSTVIHPETGLSTFNSARTSKSTCLDRYTPLSIRALEERIAAFTNTHVYQGEPFQIAHYDVGEQYHPHFDFFEEHLDTPVTRLSQSGQRTHTLILYLNTVTEGGETHFPKCDLKIKPEIGKALLFKNLADGALDRQTLHASLPVIQGEKWILTKWIRQRNY